MKKNKLIVVQRPRLYWDGGNFSEILGSFGSLMQNQGGQGTQEAQGGGATGSGSLMPYIFKQGDKLMQATKDVVDLFMPKQEPAQMVSGRAMRGYDLGGYMDLASTAVEQIGQAVSMGTAVNDKAKAVKEDIKGNLVTPKNVTSTTNLLNQWSAFNPIQHITWNDLTNKGNAGSFIMDSLSMGSKGAAAGASTGNPIATIAGGVGGTLAGIFGNVAANVQAKKQAKKINRFIDSYNLASQRAFTTAADELDDTMIQNDLRNYTGWSAAYGGPLFKYGGGIYIKPSKRGTFTEAANKHNMGVQEFASQVSANKDNYSTAMVKKANFARNASKWKHALGGNLMTHGANFDTGVTLIGNGGSHEENPYEGVQMGMDDQGIPNLVEEGEVIFNDYVFSKRLQVPKYARKKYRLGGPLSFAQAALKMSKESEERPNDPISQTGLQDSMQKLMVEQEQIRNQQQESNMQGNKFSGGGSKKEKRAPLTFEEYSNSYNNAQGNYEVFRAILGNFANKYDYDNNLMFNDNRALKEEYRLPRIIDYKFSPDYTKTYPDYDPEIDAIKLGSIPSPIKGVAPIDDFKYRDLKETPYTKEEIESWKKNPPLSFLELLDRNKDKLKQNTNIIEEYYKSPLASKLPEIDMSPLKNYDMGSKNSNKKSQDYLRLAPILSQGSQYLQDLFGLSNRPDFNLGRQIRQANNQLINVGTRPAGYKRFYKPVDQWAAINDLNAQMAAQRSAMRNAGNRVQGAGNQLASAYNQNLALGQLYAGMEDTNWKRLGEVISHNTQVDQANRQAELSADQINANLGTARANNLIAAAKADADEEQAYATARASNRDNFYNSLGELGKERINRKMMQGLLESDILGTPNQSLLEALSYLGINPQMKRSASKGGKIKRRKKKGLTY